MFCNIPGSGFSFLHHDKLLQFSRQVQRYLDVSFLGSLIATGEQDHKRLSALNEIDSVPRTIVDTQFRDALSHRFHIAGVAQRQAADARINMSPRLSIFQPLEPFGIFISLPDFYHGSKVSYGIHKGKKNLAVTGKIFLR
jgi:hypothetical protein